MLAMQLPSAAYWWTVNHMKYKRTRIDGCQRMNRDNDEVLSQLGWKETTVRTKIQLKRPKPRSVLNRVYLNRTRSRHTERKWVIWDRLMFSYIDKISEYSILVIYSIIIWIHYCRSPQKSNRENEISKTPINGSAVKIWHNHLNSLQLNYYCTIFRYAFSRESAAVDLNDGYKIQWILFRSATLFLFILL